MKSAPVPFRGYAFDLPEAWRVEVGETQVLAVLPEEGPFVQNIVVQVVDGTTDPVAELGHLAGAVPLSRRRAPGALPADEIIFGHPAVAAAVTTVQLVGDPDPEGRLVVTYSADATRFPQQWPQAQDILRSVRRTP